MGDDTEPFCPAARLSASPQVTGAMPAQPPQPGYDPWRDAHGTPIPPQCRIEQIAVGKSHGALPSRLHKHAQVIGRSLTRLTVRFDGENDAVGIRPHLVRVLDAPDGR